MKIKKAVILFMALIMVASPACIAYGQNEPENTIYVSVNGDDGNEGTETNPLATLEGAKEKAKTLSGKTTVVFREGTYTFDKTVFFGKDDKPGVTYKSFDGEKVIFTAGIPYTGFEECTVNGVKAFRKNVGKGADFNILFNDKTTLPRTRYPESGYLHVKNVEQSYCTNYDILREIDRTYACACVAMDVNPEDIPGFKNPGDTVVRILHFWKDEMLGIRSYDPETGHMEFSRESSMTIRENDRFFVENVIEALDNPGEWYLDKPEGILYYIPYENEKASELTLWGSETETLVSISGVDGISFEKIIFRGNGFKLRDSRDFSQAAYDAPSCIFCENCKNIGFKNCEFRDIAACAVQMCSAVSDSTVDSCIFDNIGAQAVCVRGENLEADNPRVTGNIDITNNSISSFGRVYFNAVGILVIHANSVNVCNNEIHDGYYTAISVGWVWGYGHNITGNCRICDNLIYNIGQGWLSDMGGIYTLGNQPGTVLSGNVIHNVAADPDEGGYGGWGIYLDEGSAFITVEKNLVYSCGSDAYHLHYGSTNTVKNNIFALSGESQVRICSAPDKVREEKETSENAKLPSAVFTHNIYLTDKNVRAYSYWDDEAFEESDNIFWDISKGRDVLIGYYSDPKHATGVRTAVRKGYLTNAHIIDPQFNDPGNADFSFRDAKPVEETGFEPWDYDKAGTIEGTTVGISLQGGKTPYNADSAAVPMTSAKEPFHLIQELICTFCDWFTEIFKIK